VSISKTKKIFPHFSVCKFFPFFFRFNPTASFFDENIVAFFHQEQTFFRNPNKNETVTTKKKKSAHSDKRSNVAAAAENPQKFFSGAKTKNALLFLSLQT